MMEKTSHVVSPGFSARNDPAQRSTSEKGPKVSTEYRQKGVNTGRYVYCI